MVRRKKKQSKPLSQQPCKNGCGKLIPIPMQFCSSKCWREYYNKDNKNNKQTDLVKNFGFPSNIPKTLKIGKKR